ncbi:MAG: type II toxin-antitoxin system HicA family toxin [Chloroflexi bacterium]|nr:type II toxin-antitoxin system HicA family toxin [Chloroflexota bacterium]
MKVRDIIKVLEADGWFVARITGSHRHFKHGSKSGAVTIPGHPNDDLSPKTLDSILKQAGLKR